MHALVFNKFLLGTTACAHHYPQHRPVAVEKAMQVGLDRQAVAKLVRCDDTCSIHKQATHHTGINAMMQT